MVRGSPGNQGIPKKKQPTVAPQRNTPSLERSTVEAYIGLGVAIVMVVHPVNMVVKVFLIVILLAICGDVTWRSTWAQSLSYLFRGLLLILVTFGVIAFCWEPLVEQYRSEYVHDTFPILIPQLNPIDSVWVLSLAGRGHATMRGIDITIGDMIRAESYLAPQSLRIFPNGTRDFMIFPSEKWIQNVYVPELVPSSQAVRLIPMSPNLSADNLRKFDISFMVSSTHYGEYIVLRKNTGVWAKGIRLVDFTHHLNLVHCADPGIGPQDPTRRFKDGDAPCSTGIITNIRPWESWQREPDGKGPSAF